MQSLQSATLLKQWYNSCQQYQLLNQKIRQYLPENLRPFFLHASRREGQHLVLILNDSSAYFVFHQYVQTLQKELKAWYQFQSLSIRVAPGISKASNQEDSTHPQDKTIKMSQKARESFQSLQQRVRHDNLRLSIEKLLKNNTS